MTYFFQFNVNLLNSFLSIDTLYLFFPGEYIIGAILFLVSLVVLRRDIQYIQQQHDKKDQPEPRSSTQTTSSHYGSASTLATDE